MKNKKRSSKGFIVRKTVAMFFATVMVLQGLNTAMLAAGQEIRKIRIADSIGKYYKEDIETPELNTPETSDTTDTELAKEAPVYDDSSEYEGYKEVESKRTPNSKTYDLGNGTYVNEVYFEPIHKEENGKLVDLDNTLVTNSRIRSAVPIFHNEDGLFDFGVSGDTATITNDKKQVVDWKYPDGDFTKYDVKDNVIYFTSVYENIDMEYVIRGDKVFTKYVINGPMDSDKITYQVNIHGLQAKQETEYIDLVDDKGNSVYKLVKPSIKDGESMVGESSMSYKEVDKDTIEVEVKINKTWVNAEARVYPIQIEAFAASESEYEELSIESSYVRSDSPTIPSSQYSDLFVGYDMKYWGGPDSLIGVARTYVHVAKPPLGDNQKVVSAQLRLFKEQDGIEQGIENEMGRTIEAYKTAGYVSPYDLRWNTQPPQNTWTHLSTNNVVGPKGQYYDFDVTSYIQDIYDGKDKTLVLTATDESPAWHANVFNSESTDNRQIVHIVYRDAWDVSPETDINQFDTEMRVTAEQDKGFRFLSFDGIAKPYYTVNFNLQELQKDGTRIPSGTVTSNQPADPYYQDPIVITAPKGTGFIYNPAYTPNMTTGQGRVNYTTDYIPEGAIPKFDTFYEYAVQVVKDADKSTNAFYSDGFIKYKVKNGDTLKSIASYYANEDLTIEAIKKENNLISNKLIEGQVLLLRYSKNNPKVPVTVYQPPLKEIDYEATWVDRGPECATCEVGDPINVLNGNFYYETEDFTLTDYQAFTMNRYYNSIGPRISNMFGNGFTTPYEQYLGYDKDGNILYFTGDGTIIQIKKSGNGFTPNKEDLIEFKANQDSIEIKDIKTGKKYIFDSYGTLTTIIERSGFESTVQYNEYGRITGVKLGDKQISFTYNELSAVSKVTLPNGKATTYTYDNNRNLTSYTDTMGYKETYTYDKNNFLTSVTDKNGNKIANNMYDKDGEVQTQLDGNGNKLTLNYKEGKTDVTYSDGVTNTYEHKDGNATKLVMGDGSFSTYEYNEYGEITKEVNAEGEVTTNAYNGVDPIKISYPDGTTEEYQYNQDHNITFHKLKDDTTESFTYSGLNLTKHTTSTGKPEDNITITYDDKHRVLSEATATGAKKTYTYAGNLVATITHSNGLIESFTYDKMGNKLTEKDNQGKSISYQYNDRNQVIKKTYTDGTNEQWNYDGNNNIIQYVDRIGGLMSNSYDKNNNLVKTVKDKFTITKKYDAHNQIVEEVNEQGLVTKTTYDDNQRKVSETDVYGNETKYEYDSLGRTIKTTDIRGNEEVNEYERSNLIETTGYDGLTTTYEYDAYERIIKQVNPNGTEETKEYDKAGNVVKEVDSFGNETTYEYDKYNRQVKSTKTFTDKESIVTENSYDVYNNLVETKVDGVSTKHTYDEYNQEVSTTDALGHKTTKQYDFDGNVVKETDALGNSKSTQYDGVGNITKETDKNGNSSITQWDKNGFMVSITDAMGFTTTYGYNGKGQNVTITDPYGIVTTFTYDAYNLHNETQLY